jgi:hypothetical protein
MAGPAYNGIVIVDSEYLFAEQILNTYIQDLEQAASDFSSLCGWTLDLAITESDIRTGLMGLSSDMTAVNTQLDELSRALSGKSQAFINKIDGIDQFIY